MMGQNNHGDVHAWLEERLSGYIDNQLASSERAQLDKHLVECDQCRASFELLKWTVSLVKQAPAPVSKRLFTLTVPPKRQPAFAFGFASFATVVATVLLFAVIGVDLITQFGGGTTASAPAQAAKANVAPTLAVALAPQPSPAAPSALLAAPTSAPQASQAPRFSEAAKPTNAPLLPAPAAAPTSASNRTGATVETATSSVLDSSKSQGASSSAAPKQSVTGASEITATVTLTATLAPAATLVPPTATLAPTTIALVQSAPTVAPIPPPVTQAQPIVSPLRIAELGLLFVVVFFGVLVVLLRRR